MAMTDKIELNREYLTTSQAAERSGLSKNYLTQLLRKGTLEGLQVARDWLIYTDSLERFLGKPRKSGPKGPRKKKLEQENSSDTTSRPTTDGKSDGKAKHREPSLQ
jgi:excisionase family DNA binding protein